MPAFRVRDQSSLMPANLTTLAHFSVCPRSACRNRRETRGAPCHAAAAHRGHGRADTRYGAICGGAKRTARSATSANLKLFEGTRLSNTRWRPRKPQAAMHHGSADPSQRLSAEERGWDSTTAVDLWFRSLQTRCCEAVTTEPNSGNHQSGKLLIFLAVPTGLVPVTLGLGKPGSKLELPHAYPPASTVCSIPWCSLIGRPRRC